MQRYLKQSKTGTVYPYTAQLALRKDMVESDLQGNLVDPPPEPKKAVEVSGLSEQAVEMLQTEAVNGVKAEIAAVAKSRFEVELDANMPIPDMLDAILVSHEAVLDAKNVVDKMTKAEMVAFAKEQFNVDLDPDLKADAMRATIRELQGN